MINLDYKSGKTLHEQIESGIKDLIINGILEPDEALPSVRDLSISLTVNPNTVQRAYKQLEQTGFIYSVKGKGSFVASVTESKSDKIIEELYETLVDATKELAFLGEDRKKILKIIENIYAEKEGAL